ncbi:MAG TPA: glycosyltransferase family 2 protein [Caulobacteraceae bacterium]
MRAEPLISCLMVTLPVPERFERLKRSLDDYAAQTHERRELVIVANGGTPEAVAAIKAHVASLARDDIRIVEPPGTLTLGALRNISKASARGEVVCQWDDDDLFHPERLERQLDALVASGAEAVCLEQVMQFFTADRRLYWLNFHTGGETAFAGSLMCWTRTPIVYPESGERARLGEDTDVACQLVERGGLHVLADMPHLYVYVCHGANSWSEWHHRFVARYRGLSPGLLRRREAKIRQDLSVFDFGPGAVTVHGPNGPAFAIGGDGETPYWEQPLAPLPSRPLVSCLMVTLPVPERLAHVKQAIAAYLAQTHEPRELVMVIDGRIADPTTPQIRSHVAALGRDDIRIVEAPPGLTLGALRNLSKANARGEVICIWDDDDLHHPERLARQIGALVEAGAESTAMQTVMQFFPDDRSLYCLSWSATSEHAMPATLMCRNSAPIVYPETGERALRGEDMEVMWQLQGRGRYHVMTEAPHLFVYVSHGANTYDDGHHRRIAAGFSLSRALIWPQEAALREGLAAFDFGPGEVTVRASNGPAFTLAAPAAGDG